MFDLSWAELLLIAVVALFAFGPEDIPKMMYNAGKILRRIRYMRYALTNQFENFMDDIEHKASAPTSDKQPLSNQSDQPNQPAPDADFDEAAADEELDDSHFEAAPKTTAASSAPISTQEAPQNDRPDQPDQPR